MNETQTMAGGARCACGAEGKIEGEDHDGSWVVLCSPCCDTAVERALAAAFAR